MNDSAPPSPMSAAGKVAPPAGGPPSKKIPKSPQPIHASVPSFLKDEEKVDTSEAVSILKEVARDTLKSSQVLKNKVPRPAKIDGKAVERFRAQIEGVVDKEEAAKDKPSLKKSPEPATFEGKFDDRPLTKPSSKISDRIPEKGVEINTAKVPEEASEKENGVGSSGIKKATDRVTLKSTPVGSPKAVENVQAEVIKTNVIKPEPTQKEQVKQEQFRASKAKVTVEEAAKRPWWKFWGKRPEIAVDCKADELVEGAKRPLTEEELVHKRHEALIDSVNQICHSLEASTNRPIEVKATDLVPLIPGDDIDTLNRTQELVSGVLKQVSGRLEKAGERDAVMLDSLNSMDKSITSLNDVGERTITTMDGMKGILSQVSGAMVTMQTELKQSSKRYEELLKRVQKTESENIVKVQKLQKSTLWVNVILGIAVIAGLIAVAISKAG